MPWEIERRDLTGFTTDSLYTLHAPLTQCNQQMCQGQNVRHHAYAALLMRMLCFKGN